MDYLSNYQFWVENDYFDQETKRELESIRDNEKEIEDRFYKDLEFGTGGLRGVIGAGLNRMNKYTVRKATQGLANYILKYNPEYKIRGVVISFDSRLKSDEFALEVAKVLAGNGINAFLFDELRPVPVLSFAVRYFKAAAGVMITASHNPREYNGYKVYGEDGGQITLETANAILEEITSIKDITKVHIAEKEDAERNKLIKIVGKEIDDEYMKCLKTLCINPEVVRQVADKFGIVYTPLNGTGNKPVRRILQENGFKRVLVVKEQELPDPNFSTVRVPNPEERDSLELAVKLAKEENVDLIIGTDPDCDRVGVGVRNKSGEFMVLTGNQTGCLLLEYILSQKKERGELPKNGFVVKTIVTTEMARNICKKYDIELIEVLTGFKFIGEKIKELDEFGDKKYLFGFEESFGYLAGTFARDKDGVVTSMLIAEMAAFYYKKGMTLYEALQELYKNYGYYLEGIKSYTLKGKDGLEKIGETMKNLRRTGKEAFKGINISALRDYGKGVRYDFVNGKEENLTLPKSNVLYYELGNSNWFCVRPSGTEPKIKIYYGVNAKSEQDTNAMFEKVKSEVLEVVEKLLN